MSAVVVAAAVAVSDVTAATDGSKLDMRAKGAAELRQTLSVVVTSCMVVIVTASIVVTVAVVVTCSIDVTVAVIVTV